MDIDRARQLCLLSVPGSGRLLASSAKARAEDNDAERDAGDGDADGAQPLEHEALDIAIASSLRERLAAVDRAEARLANGTYGLSVESGVTIPDDRLEDRPGSGADRRRSSQAQAPSPEATARRDGLLNFRTPESPVVDLGWGPVGTRLTLRLARSEHRQQQHPRA